MFLQQSEFCEEDEKSLGNKYFKSIAEFQGGISVPYYVDLTYLIILLPLPLSVASCERKIFQTQTCETYLRSFTTQEV